MKETIELPLTLDTLRDLLNDHERERRRAWNRYCTSTDRDARAAAADAYQHSALFDLSELPTFSQRAPADTSGIFSFDCERALIYDCGEWLIVPREDVKP